MKKLILIRHSFAESGSFNAPDSNRRLTPEGKNKANLQAICLLKKGFIPDLIISSAAIRAFETAEIFSKVLPYKGTISKKAFLYEDFTTVEFFNLLNSIDSLKQTVLLVGHNPTISLMAARIDMDSMVSFRPGSIGIFDIAPAWSKLEVGNGKMTEYME